MSKITFRVKIRGRNVITPLNKYIEISITYGYQHITHNSFVYALSNHSSYLNRCTFVTPQFSSVFSSIRFSIRFKLMLQPRLGW
jgi:hypothetical protein